MALATDIRASVYCSLGSLISGSFSDTYVQGAGLIRTRGEIILDGASSAYSSPGVAVSFAWTRDTVASRLPRKLRVFSGFSNPYTRTTTLQLGCLLSYYENRKPAPKTNPTSQQANPDVTCEAWQKGNLGIDASFVLDECLSALGITLAGDNPLTNHFSIEEFDLTSGYINVIDGLLQSEGYIGYLNESEQLVIRNLAGVNTESGPAITGSNLITLGPIGVGELAGSAAFVRYNSLRLKLPDPDETTGATLKRNWESEITFGALQEVTVSYINDAGTAVTVNDFYYPYNATFSIYDSWDRLIESISYTQSSVAEANGKWAGDRARAGQSISAACGSLVYERNTYKLAAPLSAASSINLRSIFWSGGSAGVQGALANLYAPSAESGLGCIVAVKPPDNYSDITETYQALYVSEAAMASSLSVDSFSYKNGATWDGPVAFDTAYTQTQSITKTRYDKDITTGITKTITDFAVCAGQTVTGGQEIAVLSANPPSFQSSGSFNFGLFQAWINGMVGRSARLRSAGVETRIRTEREFGLQRRPSQSDRNATSTFKEPATEQVSEIAWDIGGGDSTNAIEFTMPYAPDDKLVWLGGSDFEIEKSDAQAKALRYGRIQNALLLGNRNGISIQIPVELMPTAPFDPLYVSIDGISGQFRVNGTSYTFNADGIVATTDALFWGGVAA